MGNTVKFGLSPEARYELEQMMRERGFNDRGPFLVSLMRESKGRGDFVRQQAERLAREARAVGVTLADFQKAYEAVQ